MPFHFISLSVTFRVWIPFLELFFSSCQHCYINMFPYLKLDLSTLNLNFIEFRFVLFFTKLNLCKIVFFFLGNWLIFCKVLQKKSGTFYTFPSFCKFFAIVILEIFYFLAGNLKYYRKKISRQFFLKKSRITMVKNL